MQWPPLFSGFWAACGRADRLPLAGQANATLKRFPLHRPLVARIGIQFLALVLATAFMAGCVKPMGGTTSQATITATNSAKMPGLRDPATLPTALETPKIVPAVRLGPGAGEPNIAIAPDGAIYVSPINTVYRSTDGGKTFRATASRPSGGGDGDIAFTSSGRMHWLGLGGQPPGGPIPYQYSDNQGDKWSKPMDLSARQGADREWIDARPEGTLYASWRGALHGESVIAVNVSFDDGQTWGQLTSMAPDAVGGPIVHGPTPGTVYEAMTTFGEGIPPTGSKILLARSADHGANWELKEVFSPIQSVQFGLIGFATSIFPVASVDQAGTVYVVFSADQRALPETVPKPLARFSVFLTASKDDGETWTKPIMLSDPTKAALMPWIAAGAPGRVAVTWYENTYGLPSESMPDLWNVKLYESITADQAAPKGVTVQLNSEPSHVGNVCTSGTGCAAGGRSLLDFFEVALDHDGQPIVAWASSNQAGGAPFVGRTVVPTINFFGTVEGTPLQ